MVLRSASPLLVCVQDPTLQAKEWESEQLQREDLQTLTGGRPLRSPQGVRWPLVKHMGPSVHSSVPPFKWEWTAGDPQTHSGMPKQERDQTRRKRAYTMSRHVKQVSLISSEAKDCVPQNSRCHKKGTSKELKLEMQERFKRRRDKK